MSAREFKPGDVAMIRVNTGDWEYGLLREDGLWLCQHPRLDERRAWEEVQARPLVVIDPEGNPEGLPYLVPQHFRNYAATLRKHRGPVSARMLEWLAECLEEYVPKPRIEEPTGLGAVVEDDSGQRWVRGPSHNTFKWLREGAPGCEEWADVNAVRVLHKGVTA